MIPGPNAVDLCSEAYRSAECDLMSVKIEYSNSLMYRAVCGPVSACGWCRSITEQSDI